MTCANSRPDPTLILMVSAGQPILIHYPLSIPVLFIGFRDVCHNTVIFSFAKVSQLIMIYSDSLSPKYVLLHIISE